MDLFAVFQGIIKAGPTVLLPLIIFALAMFSAFLLAKLFIVRWWLELPLSD